MENEKEEREKCWEAGVVLYPLLHDLGVQPRRKIPSDTFPTTHTQKVPRLSLSLLFTSVVHFQDKIPFVHDVLYPNVGKSIELASGRRPTTNLVENSAGFGKSGCRRVSGEND